MGKNDKIKYLLGIAISLCIIIGLIFIINNTIFHQKKDFQSEYIFKGNLTCDILQNSLELGTQYLINNQNPGGNFNYEYDWVNKIINTADNEVRQAGALWGISLIYNNDPNTKLNEVYKKGFEFFKNCSVEGDNGCKWISYPDSNTFGRTSLILRNICSSLFHFVWKTGNSINRITLLTVQDMVFPLHTLMEKLC